MLYPIAIHHDEGTAYGVTVPDIPGCFSAGDTLEEALKNAREAIEGHLGVLADYGETIPGAADIEGHRGNPDYAGAIWALVEVDVTPFLGKSEKINITLPSRLIRRIDAVVARDPRYKSRSGFLAQGAERLLRESAG